jgi:hypothetical protein
MFFPSLDEAHTNFRIPSFFCVFSTTVYVFFYKGLRICIGYGQKSMPTLHVDLQSGFQNDVIELALDQRSFFSAQDVTTNLVIGLAETTQVDVAPGAQELQIDVKSRGLQTRVSIEVQQAEMYVGVSIVEQNLRVNVRNKPFGYA